MTEDRNFDDIAHKFAKNIYGSDKGEVRQVIVWEDFEQILQTFASDSFPLNVLDAGGGLAQLSQKLAVQGHNITLCDVSSEMLRLAEDDITKNGLMQNFTFVHSSVQELPEEQYGSRDFVLFHAVMEWLQDPEGVLKRLLKFVRPGGVVSIMFYNQHGLVLKNAICGNIPHVLNGMPFRKRFKLQPQKGLIPDDVYRWIEESGFAIEGRSGIRSFTDYIGNKQNMGEYTHDDLIELERMYCRQEPFLSLGRYIHVWARKL
ncbi:tRNA uridine 5-oxyacetic acid(34) methyltransferase CmoM [Vibrio sp.]|uniref:tRNA 5-carboxymethoxyuridine methyltransferase n=1 Tax=Vibrio viridaestus TaxID=2487322 RepID=A0A3N9TD12_9VIBR|nr:tRNA uridine 5-oxyacetic acid(34) methyltransferase CmoM [Vibrio viridaestus]MDC0609471.1 tRNA uridine 5-oxyacetic acid(34) methyltransferase CmoM [Vibrio sp.]RQW61949.1 tRNA uridine 5-oxyacetic acid(34) methyltransferase CmoM [Vibrio viridaestus]